MDRADLVMLAEDRHAERLERKERAQGDAKASLAAEYMACATLPLYSSVFCPSVQNPQRRTPFLDVFADGLTWSKNRHLLARTVAILMRDEGGRELLQELAAQYADDYADEVAA